MINSEVNTKSNKSLIVSIVILSIVVLITAWIKYFDYSLQNKVEAYKAETISLEDEIREIKKDKIVQIYSLVEDNKKLLDEKKALNQIPGYVNEVKKIASEYGLSLKGFDYKSGEITTSAYSVNDENGASFGKITSLLTKYRENKDEMFDIKFVEWFKGSSKIEFNMVLKLK